MANTAHQPSTDADPHVPGPIQLPCMWASMRRATRAVSRLYEDELRLAGLRATQYTLLRIIEGSEAAGGRSGVTQTRLGEMAAMDVTTLTRNLRPLAQRGWVRIARGEKDRRERTIHLADPGRKILKKAFPFWERAQAKFQASLEPQQWNALGPLLVSVARGATETASPVSND